TDKAKVDALQLKLKSLVKLLIEATVKEVELFHLIQTNLWRIIGTIDGIISIIMETFIQTSIDNGIASNHTQVLTNTLRSVTANNSKIITSTIISRLLELAGSAAIQDLIDTGAWTEVAVLIRFLLMLSFDNVIDIEKHLPDLFHIITLVVGYGQPLIRGSVHGITINLVHNVCTKVRSTYGRDSPILTDMLKVLETLSDAKYRAKFGIVNNGEDSEAWATGKNDLSISFANEASANEILEGVDPYDLKDIANELVKVVRGGCGNEALAKEWKDKWFQLIVTSTFNFSYVQSRTFITLGALSRYGSSIDVLFSTVQSLMGYLPLDLTGLVVSITTCITDVVHGIPRNQETYAILKSLFWVAMGLIQICDVHIFSAGATLLKDIIQTLDSHNQFKQLGFAETLKESRSVFLKLALDMDDMTGIWFSADFGFAFTANVLKGFKFEKTRELTVSLLKVALDVSRRNPPLGVPENGHEYVADHCAGFLAPLLPVTPTTELIALFEMGGVDPCHLAGKNWEWALPNGNKVSKSGEYVSFAGGLFETEEDNKFNAILERLTPLTDENRSLLMVTIMVALLEISELEAEAIFIYGLLTETTLEAPDITFKLYESLLPRMNEIVTGPNSPSLISSVHSIFQTMMACMPLSHPTTPALLPPFEDPNSLLRKNGGSAEIGNSIAAVNGLLTNINSVMGGLGMTPNIAQSMGRSQPLQESYLSSNDDLLDEELRLRSEEALSISPNGIEGENQQGDAVGGIPGGLPLCENKVLLEHLQELGFTGLASANSFEGAGIVEPKQICGVVVQLIRVVLVQLQQTSLSP
ncbi:UNVERIFIED_CONTAM: Ras GTPase activating protein ira2, partial [Siphonaria sp. JEL0065]